MEQVIAPKPYCMDCAAPIEDYREHPNSKKCLKCRKKAYTKNGRYGSLIITLRKIRGKHED